MTITRLIWDRGNGAHIARHGVTPTEVEEVCSGDFVSFEGNNRRAILIGITRGGRVLAVVLDPQAEENVYFPVTARPASQKERRYYQDHTGGDAYDDAA